MAQKTLIIGESGTGKSTSLRNLDPTITALVNPVGKPLPFKNKDGKFTILNGETDSKTIQNWIKNQVKNDKKIIVIDDFQYLLSVPYMNRIHEIGFEKWNDFGDNYFRLIDICNDLPEDIRIYYLSHCETLDNGVTTIKLIGKLLREKITIEGLFTTVLRTSVIDQKYYFVTQNSGKDTVKSPMGMFKKYAVDNDLSYIDDKICNYYEIGNYKTDEDIAEQDQKVSADIPKPENGKRIRRKKSVDEYVEQSEEALSKIADGREEIPFEEAAEAINEEQTYKRKCREIEPKNETTEEPPKRIRRRRKENE